MLCCRTQPTERIDTKDNILTVEGNCSSVTLLQLRGILIIIPFQPEAMVMVMVMVMGDLI
jgi:hypothetical protein